MEGTENNNQDDNRRDEVYSNAVRAGKRTYFFDVKATRAEDYYLTITESKRRFNNDNQKFYFEKHKLFLYKEDFEKFSNGLDDAIAKIKELKAEQGEEIVEKVATEFSDVSFDDLGTDSAE
tara:strand:+ start:1891 stop:2253 length:363 start_codon:yes stop_codon:yes gene_type:complete